MDSDPPVRDPPDDIEEADPNDVEEDVDEDLPQEEHVLLRSMEPPPPEEPEAPDTLPPPPPAPVESKPRLLGEIDDAQMDAWMDKLTQSSVPTDDEEDAILAELIAKTSKHLPPKSE